MGLPPPDVRLRAAAAQSGKGHVIGVQLKAVPAPQGGGERRNGLRAHRPFACARCAYQMVMEMVAVPQSETHLAAAAFDRVDQSGGLQGLQSTVDGGQVESGEAPLGEMEDI